MSLDNLSTTQTQTAPNTHTIISQAVPGTGRRLGASLAGPRPGRGQDWRRPREADGTEEARRRQRRRPTNPDLQRAAAARLNGRGEDTTGEGRRIEIIQ